MPQAKREPMEVVSIRLPRGVADELRTRTKVPLSRLCRFMLTQFLEKERGKDEQKEAK